MNVLIVHAHPEPQSFNAAMTRAAAAALAAAGHAVVVSDLYAMGFDPVSSRANFASVHDPAFLKLQLEERHATDVGGFAPEIEAELRKLEAADLLILQFPLWWFGLPAILKGWVDRVFAMGRIYGGGMIYESGRFRGRRALLSLTTGAGPEAYVKDGFNGDLSAILRPIHRGVLQFVGFDVLAPQVVHAPVRLADAERDEALTAWAVRLATIDAEAPIAVGRY